MHYTVPPEVFKYHVVVRPHADDEAIGCFELYKDIDYMNGLGGGIVLHTVGFEAVRRSLEDEEFYRKHEERDLETAAFLRNFSTVKALTLFPSIESFWLHLHILIPSGRQKDTIVWFPYPTEVNPLHRKVTSLIHHKPLSCSVNCGLYSTQMDNPVFVRECSYPSDKRRILDECFVSQRDLWKYDHKYFLYEGHCILS
jgi:hypothetical protein